MICFSFSQCLLSNSRRWNELLPYHTKCRHFFQMTVGTIYPFFNDNPRKDLFITQYSTIIYWIKCLAAFDLFNMFTKLIKSYTFLCQILNSTDQSRRKLFYGVRVCVCVCVCVWVCVCVCVCVHVCKGRESEQKCRPPWLADNEK